MPRKRARRNPDRHQDQDQHRAAALAFARSRGRTGGDVEEGARAADDELADQRDDADEDGADDEKLDVAVADMGELVGEHPLELGIVERVDQPAGDGDRVLLFAYPLAKAFSVASR